ncbi:hypothetical protein pipiens_012796 [Culex pipiens pipiens]|uniref:Uncharacterized protein n=1 Tax=Culex pipiens pipiens TaxID=38569 RepID=A0ABD1D0Y4_CULPP
MSPSKSSFLSAAVVLLVVALAHGARRPQLNAELETSGGTDRMSTTDPGPPHRFHAIFHAAAAASSTAVDFKSSPAVVEKMMAAGSRDRVDNRDNNNGNKNRSTSSTRQCREGCLEKRSIKDILCTNQRECAMCWDVCNRNHQIRKENELTHRLLLSLSRMIRNESVVTADIEWTTPEELLEHQPHPQAVVPSPLAASENVERLSRIARDGAANSSAVSRIIQALSQSSSLQELKSTSGSSEQQQSFHQCLVSWEISGGGLTGNLLTETAKVELSLWPNTKYHVHVTCRNKETDQLIRSAPLLIDTSEAVIVSLQGTTTTTTTTTTMRPLAINSVIEEIDVIQEATSFTDGDPISPLQTLHQKQPARPHLWPIYSSAELPENSKEIVILGVFVAILAFVLIVLTVVILVRRKQDAIEDRELLIESEVLPKILHV